jgi:hypothetical protein
MYVRNVCMYIYSTYIDTHMWTYIPIIHSRNIMSYHIIYDKNACQQCRARANPQQVCRHAGMHACIQNIAVLRFTGDVRVEGCAPGSTCGGGHVKQQEWHFVSSGSRGCEEEAAAGALVLDMYMYVGTHMLLCTSMCKCIHTYMYMCVFIHTYLHIYTHTFP